MLPRNLATKIRHQIKKIPFARPAWFNMRLLLKPTYREDGLCTVHNADFVHDPIFNRAYSRALEMQSDTEMKWRSHVAQWAGYQASLIPGDFVECGVNRAFLSTAIIEAIDFGKLANRSFYLFDTYCGLVPELVAPEDRAAHFNEYPDVFDNVTEAFADLDNIHVVQGVVPEVLSTVEIEQVAYLSLDMNCTAPEIAALKYFWPRMTPGAIVLLDDYGWRGHEAQKEAADKFANQVGSRILCLPTGQGILIKHAKVASTSIPLHMAQAANLSTQNSKLMN